MMVRISSALALLAATACFYGIYTTTRENHNYRRRRGLRLLEGNQFFVVTFLNKQWCTQFGITKCVCKESQLVEAVEQAAPGDTIQICFDTTIRVDPPINVDGKSLTISCDYLQGIDWAVQCKLFTKFENRVFQGAPESLHFERIKFLEGDAGTGNGGAVSFTSGDISFSDCNFEANKADNKGGAIYMGESAKSLDLKNVEFAGNAADMGGAVYVENGVKVTANNVVWDDNNAFWNGGALAFRQSKVDLKNNTFKRNQALNNGNDVYIRDDLDRTGTGSFVNCEKANPTVFCDGLSGIFEDGFAIQLKENTNCDENGAIQGTNC